jgi:predicted porin
MNYKMKTIAVAAMSLAFAGAALAQADVSFYGRANVSVESQKVGSVSETAFVDNSSRFGIRAKHAIPNGMTVGTTLEAATNLTTGSTNSKLFAREASVHLAGNFGQLKLGKLPGSAAYFATADYVSNHNHDTGTSSDALWDYPAAFQLEQAIAYTSPKISGVTFEAQYGLKKGNASGDTSSANVGPISLAANYALGTLQLGLGHERGSNVFTDGDTTDTMDATTLRAYYTMGSLGFGGYVQKTTGTNADRTAIRLSAMYTVGQNEYHVNYGSAGNRASAANTGAKQFTVAYNYNLDKQTKVYIMYTKIDQESGTHWYQDKYASRFINSAASDGNTLSSVGAGIRYNF